VEKMPLKHRPQLQLAADPTTIDRKARSPAIGNDALIESPCASGNWPPQLAFFSARKLISDHDHHLNWQKRSGLRLQNAENRQEPEFDLISSEQLRVNACGSSALR
jgi:hypothetical protein